MQLYRLLKPAVILIVALFVSIPVKELRFVPIYEAMTIKAHKNSPPHVAFEELLADNQDIQLWNSIDNPPFIHTLKAGETSVPLVPNLSLSELVISKEEALAGHKAQIVSPSTSLAAFTNHAASIDQGSRLPAGWDQTVSRPAADRQNISQNEEYKLDDLNRRQLNRLQIAQERGIEIENLLRESLNADVSSESQAANDTNYSNANSGSGYQVVGSKTVEGLLEISEGLAVTDENKIEIRRYNEGSYHEAGRISLRDGTYSIQIDDLAGAVIAQLKDKQGKVLGEGQVRIGNLAQNKMSRAFAGPKINIRPSTAIAAILPSYYNEKADDLSPPQTVASLFRGAKEYTPGGQDGISMAEVQKGSSTVLRAHAPNHLQTISMMTTGNQIKAPLFPESMISALYNIVAEDRGIANPEEYRVIWGQVNKGNESAAGLEVILESFPALTAIYFNEFNIPDSNLKTTSKNGIYAFVNVPEGFHSLVALDKEQIVGYQNTNVEADSVSVANIDISADRVNVPLKVYDAFTGQGQSALVEMQTLSESIAVNGGTMVPLPSLNRMGFIRAAPTEADYVSAKYLYNDSDISINVPLVKWDWIVRVRELLKVPEMPSVGIVVGFVPGENFEVYLAGYDHFPTQNIVYFDTQGKVLNQNKGIKGGGFIIYNVPEDTQEVVVYGADSHKINSKVLPVDRNSLSVLTYLSH